MRAPYGQELGGDLWCNIKIWNHLGIVVWNEEEIFASFLSPQ